jgi:K+-transporting ATPase ATPase C chain
MKHQLKTAVLMTIITTVICGLLYPLAVTGLAQLIFPRQANGELIQRNAAAPVIGSHLIGQPFSGDEYFHSRPSAAGAGYDPTASGGSNLGPTSRILIERVRADVAKLHAENPNAPIPVDLITASGSGLDPDISPAAAEFQVPRIARARHIGVEAIRALVHQHTTGRQFGFLGEPRVNVLDLNLALDAASAPPAGH